MYRNIVVAYDGSDGAQAALRNAVALAEAAGGTLHLVESTGHLEYATQGVLQGASGAESSALSALEDAADQLDETHVVTRVVSGDPVQGIIRAAEDIDADLIVMGSRGRAMMPQAVLGRVSSGVVNNSPCDILVVHPLP